MGRCGRVLGAMVGAVLLGSGCAAGVEAPDVDDEETAEAPALTPPTSPPTSPATEPESAAPVCPVAPGTTFDTYPPGAIATLSWDGVDPSTTEILVYPAHATAACAPLAVLRVPAAPGAIASLAFDRDRHLYTLEYSGRISVYASGASGNVTPTRVLNPTGLYTNEDPTYLEDLAIDGRGQLYVSLDTRYDQPGPDGVLVYASDASGDATPTRFISGPSTGFQLPTELALDANDRLYVADYEASRVYVFPDGADGDVAPTRTVVSPIGVQAMTVAADGRLFIAPEGTPEWSVRVYAPFDGSAQRLQGVIKGPATGLGAPIAMATDIDGGVAVITSTGGLDYSRGASGDVRPRGTFGGWNAIAVAPLAEGR